MINIKRLVIATIICILLSSSNLVLAKTKTLKINSTLEFNPSENNKWALMLDFPNYHETYDAIELFCQQGWSKENIRLLTGEQCTKTNIIENFSWIKDHSTNSDSVFIYIDAHGSISGFGTMNKLAMNWRDLGDQVDKINANKIALFIKTCHSGAAIPYLEDNNRIIVTSCKSDETTCSLGFCLHVGIQGYADYEGNFDGYVSIEELFNYANKEITPCGTPQIVDNIPGDFPLLTVDKEYLNTGHIDNYHLHPMDEHGMVGDEYKLAQSFTPYYSKLTKIRFLPLFGNKVEEDLTVYLRKSLIGDNLASIVIPSEDLTEMKFFDTDFSDTEVIPGEKYYLVFESNSTQIGHDSYFHCLTADNYEEDEYTEGECYMITPQNDNWEEQENLDILFITYSEDEVKPDFIVSTLKHSFVNEEDKTSQITVSINNRGGNYNGEDVKVDITFPGGEKTLFFDYSGNGEIKTLSFTPEIVLKNGDTILAEVDPDQEIVESNEINNELSTKVGEKTKINLRTVGLIENFLDKFKIIFNDFIYKAYNNYL